MQHVLHVINAITVAVHDAPPGFWQALVASGILSPALKAIKHWQSIESERVMFGVVVFVSGALSVGSYLITKYPANPSIIALHTGVLAFMTQPFYFFAVKPLWGYFGTKFGEAAQLEAQLKSAVLPPEGLPAVQPDTAQAALRTSITTEDFSH